MRGKKLTSFMKKLVRKIAHSGQGTRPPSWTPPRSGKKKELGWFLGRCDEPDRKKKTGG